MKLVGGVFLAIAGTYLVVRAVAMLAIRLTGVPRDFPPFTTLPLLAGVAGGFLAASCAYAAVSRFSATPNRTFFFVAIVCLALSFGLPLRLSYTKSHRFAGVTPAAQMTLALLHTIIATSAVGVLTRLSSSTRLTP